MNPGVGADGKVNAEAKGEAQTEAAVAAVAMEAPVGCFNSSALRLPPPRGLADANALPAAASEDLADCEEDDDEEDDGDEEKGVNVEDAAGEEANMEVAAVAVTTFDGLPLFLARPAAGKEEEDDEIDADAEDDDEAPSSTASCFSSSSTEAADESPSF